ncbi:hypothetical protein P7K49_026860, partial [Saguinus oedipus]
SQDRELLEPTPAPTTPAAPPARVPPAAAPSAAAPGTPAPAATPTPLWLRRSGGRALRLTASAAPGVC